MGLPYGRIGKHVIRHLGEAGLITLFRFRQGVNDQTTGEFEEGLESSSKIDAAVNPMTARESKYLPEGEQTKEGISFFTLEAARTASSATGAQADEVEWKSKRYRVMFVEDWTAQAKYAWAIATRIGDV